MDTQNPLLSRGLCTIIAYSAGVTVKFTLVTLWEKEEEWFYCIIFFRITQEAL